VTVFSASSVNAYLDCHLRWWFQYVAVVPYEPSEAQATGIEVHRVAEVLIRGETASYDKALDPLVRVFADDIMPTIGQIMAVEEPFLIEVNGILYSGIFDLLDGHEGVFDTPYFALRDLKTTGSRPAKGKYRFNMIGYTLGARSLGYVVDEVRLDYIVRTLKPYYWPEVQPIPDEDEIDGWRATLENVADKVEQGDFEPTGLGTYVCSYCNFKSECGPYQRLTAISPLREGTPA